MYFYSLLNFDWYFDRYYFKYWYCNIYEVTIAIRWVFLSWYNMKGIISWWMFTTFYPNLNSFHATCLFLYPLKTSENLWLSDVFEWYRKRLVWRKMGNRKHRSLLSLFFNVHWYFLTYPSKRLTKLLRVNTVFPLISAPGAY